MRKSKHSIRGNTHESDPQKNATPEEPVVKSDLSRLGSGPEFGLPEAGADALAGPAPGASNPVPGGGEAAIPGTGDPDMEEVRGRPKAPKTEVVASPMDANTVRVETVTRRPDQGKLGDRIPNLEPFGKIEEIVGLFGYACGGGPRGCGHRREDLESEDLGGH